MEISNFKVARFKATAETKNELIDIIKKYQPKVSKLLKDEQIGKLTIHTSRKNLLQNYQLNEHDSKDLMEEYSLVDYSGTQFRNHIINRYMNESDSGLRTQARLVIEGIMGVCVIDYIPFGWSNGDSLEIGSTDKGNFLRGHTMIFSNEVQPSQLQTKIPTLRFTKSKLTQIIDSSAALSTPQLSNLRRAFQSKLDDKFRYTIREAFDTIGRGDLVDDYLNSECTLNIVIGDDDVIIKEMIDTNNIFNLWESVVYAYCSISKDSKETDLGNVLSDIFSENNKSYTDFLEKKYLSKIKKKLSSCKEYYLLPVLLLEGYKNGFGQINSDTKNKIKFLELCERYADVNSKNWMQSPIVDFTSKYISKTPSLNFDDSIKFIGLLNDGSITKEFDKFTKVVQSLETAIDKHIDVDEINKDGYKKNDLSKFRFTGSAASEETLLYFFSKIYYKLSKKQSFHTKHITFILSRMRKTLESSFETKKDGRLFLTESSIKGGLKKAITNAGYKHRIELSDSLFESAFSDYDNEYGSKSKNAEFKRKEVEVLTKLWEEAKIKNTPIPFVVPTGKLNDEEFLHFDDIRDNSFSMDWSHIESGVDKFENGYLWGDIQRGVGASSQYLYDSKLDAYTTMVDVMEDSKLNPAGVVLWKMVLDYWKDNYKADLTNF